MTTRALKGLDAIRDAATQAPPAVHVLVLDGVPRTGLTTREVAKITGFPYDRVCREIQAGRIRVIGGGNSYVIPVSELAAIAAWADYVDRPA